MVMRRPPPYPNSKPLQGDIASNIAFQLKVEQDGVVLAKYEQSAEDYRGFRDWEAVNLDFVRSTGNFLVVTLTSGAKQSVD